MTALAALAVTDTARLVRLADVAGAMSLEALMGTNAAFDERIHRLRPHPGQLASAANLRRLTAESGIIASHRDCTRVQDAYSLRCMPQVHGAAREALAFAGAVVARELGSVSDNPLVFPADGAVLSGGNFHGQVLGLVLDTLAIGLAQLAGIAERRVDRLVNPLTSEGLPPFLSPHGGVHSGYMLAQYVAAALVAELRTLAHPASVDSIPTSGLQEDYNSMGAGAALKLRRALALVRQVLAIELVLAAQALDLRAPLEPGRGSAAARVAVRRRIPPLAGDRYLKADLDAARAHALAGNVLAFKVVNGRRDDLAPDGGATDFEIRGVKARDWRTLRVDFAGAEFRVSLDGRRLFTVRDGALAGPGAVGCWSKADSVTEFERFEYGAT